MKPFKTFIEDSPCWDGYKKVPGKKDFEKGSCEKIKEEEETFKAPAAAAAAAKKAIKWKEEHGDEVKGGTQIGWTRAHQLANNENLSLDTVKRMASFNRHRKNSKVAPEYKDTPWKDSGLVAWYLWGGDAGVDWAMKISDQNP
jgi:hypothetical protein